MSRITVHVLDTWIGEHIGISPLTKKQIKPKKCSVGDHLLLCNYSVSYDDFSILAHQNKKLLRELKECLFIMRDQSAPLIIQQALVIRSLLEFYLFLMVATSFLLNGLNCHGHCNCYLKVSTTVRDSSTVLLGHEIEDGSSYWYFLLGHEIEYCYSHNKDWKWAEETRLKERCLTL